jgi:hypothetical protein
MKKVIVIPYDQYEALKNQSTLSNKENVIVTKDPEIFNDPLKEKIMKTELDLKNLLDSDINLDQKRVKYVQLFDQLQNFLQMLKRSPENAQIPESGIEGEDQLEKWVEKSLPPTLKTKGTALYHYLKTQQGITWDKNNGEIAINNTLLRGTNIIDLVADLIRPHKGVPVTGWKPISLKLRQNNIPLSLINNKYRLKDLTAAFPSPLSTSTATPILPNSLASVAGASSVQPIPQIFTPTSTSTPIGSSVRKKPKKRLRGNAPYVPAVVFRRRVQKWASF